MCSAGSADGDAAGTRGPALWLHWSCHLAPHINESRAGVTVGGHGQGCCSRTSGRLGLARPCPCPPVCMARKLCNLCAPCTSPSPPFPFCPFSTHRPTRGYIAHPRFPAFTQSLSQSILHIQYAAVTRRRRQQVQTPATPYVSKPPRHPSTPPRNKKPLLAHRLATNFFPRKLHLEHHPDHTTHISNGAPSRSPQAPPYNRLAGRQARACCLPLQLQLEPQQGCESHRDGRPG